MKIFTRFFLIIALLFAAVSAGAATIQPQTLQLNREGNALFAKQSYQAALDKYIAALKYNPFAAELHLNMGLAFEALQQPEKAMQSYAQAEKLATNPATRFAAIFNQAQLLGKDKKIDEALVQYQKALEIDPTSKEAKTNIELLIQEQQKQKQQGGKDGKQGQQNPNPNQKQDQNKDQNKDQQKKDQNQPDKQNQDKQYQNTPKYVPRKFDSKELSESDVKKILGELRQQEQKIRAEFNRKEVKERPRDKDW